MDARAGRIFLGLAGLVLVWILAYWAWDPGARTSPPISFDDLTPAVATTRSPEPVAPQTRPQASLPDPVRQQPIAERPVRTAPPSVVIEPPRFEEYVVRSGDSFEKIAQRAWGRRSYWTRIAHANPYKDPRRIKPGDVIRIPLDPDNIQGREIVSEPAPPHTDDKPEPAPEPVVITEPEQPEVIEYTVKRGDTLGKIARAYYGSTGFAEFIFFNNQDRLESMDDLSVGQKLVLPPIPAQDDG